MPPQDCRNNVNLALGKDSWSPFNSQNTYWFPDAYTEIVVFYVNENCYN
ncbi:hypothetical protein [Okeania sp. SIO2B3]|nr:hypothetical protein [Okeania sp. SIO2B3]NET42662.1 hypothetical protein [Okeania sp. SIO2B3]